MNKNGEDCEKINKLMKEGDEMKEKKKMSMYLEDDIMKDERIFLRR